MTEQEGKKYDTGKPGWDLMPWGPLEDVVYVLMHGAKKYAPDNWKHVPFAKVRYIAAAIRHMIARAMGRIVDKETKLPHTAHAICCLLFLGWFDKKPREKTQRVYISGPISGKEDYNRAAFYDAELLLEARGYFPVNPFDLNPISDDMTYTDYLRADLKALCDCDYIYLLDGWEQSNGARIEAQVAEKLGLIILTREDMES